MRRASIRPVSAAAADNATVARITTVTAAVSESARSEVNTEMTNGAPAAAGGVTKRSKPASVTVSGLAESLSVMSQLMTQKSQPPLRSAARSCASVSPTKTVAVTAVSVMKSCIVPDKVWRMTSPSDRVMARVRRAKVPTVCALGLVKIMLIAAG